MHALALNPAAAIHAPQGTEWLALLPSYLLGAVPFGWVMARLIRGVDLRTVGSGNIGATNAMRVLGRPLGVLAFLLDFGKGWVPAALFATWFARGGGESRATLAVLCGAAAVCGHVWPVYLRFRGGKAVATGCGAIAAIDPVVFLAGGLAWLATLVFSRYVSLASIAMGLAFPLCAWARLSAGRGGAALVAGTAVLTLLILWRHRANLERILSGTEPKAGRRAPAEKRESHV